MPIYCTSLNALVYRRKFKVLHSSSHTVLNLSGWKFDLLSGLVDLMNIVDILFCLVTIQGIQTLFGDVVSTTSLSTGLDSVFNMI